MPTYVYRNLQTEEIEEHFMKMSEKDAFEKANPEFELVLGTPGFVRGVATKPDSGFRDVLHKIKDRHSGGISKPNINTF